MSKQPKRVRKTSGVGHISGDHTGATPNRNQIALLAYRLWQDRGCPLGSPEEDWNRAETELQQGAHPGMHGELAAGAGSSASGGK